MAIKENVLPLAQDSGSGYIRTVSSGGVSQRTAFDTVKGAITADMDEAIADEVDAREAADTQLQTEIDGKVDKVTGKGLSANDFTNTLKAKLDGIEEGAEVNPTVDSALSTSSENPVQNKVITGAVNGIQDELNDKPNWTVGSAEQIVSDDASQTESTPYTFRRSGGGLIPFNFTREELSKVVGGTVGWNQLVQKPTAATQTINGVTFTNNNDGSITVNGTASGGDAVLDLGGFTFNVAGKYVMRGCPSGGSLSTYYLGNAVLGDTGNGYIWDVTTVPSSTGFRIYVKNGTTVSNKVFTPQITNITAMLGTAIANYAYSLETATAGAGVAKLKEWGFFTKPYYVYDPGSLQSVCVGAHETVGFNAWDEDWESGSINSSTGANQTNASAIRSKGFIKVLEGQTYYIKSASYALIFLAYDENKNFISGAFGGYNTAQRQNNELVIPKGVAYVRFNASATTYNNDICINLSKPTGTPKNGDYVPYDAHSYPIEPVTLRGLFKLDSGNNLYCDGDVYSADGGVQRKYGVVDLGTLDWVYYTSGANPIFYSTEIAGKNNSYGNSGVCSKYTIGQNESSATNAGNNLADKQASLTYNTSTPRIYIRDSAYTDAPTFKAAMSGVYLVYELATPTTETADPYTAIQICDSDGTEQYVDALVASGDRDVAIPAGHETVYYEDMAGKLADLPPIPSAPSANGTYTLQAVVSSGTVTYQWTS